MDASFLDLLMAQQEEVVEAEGGGGGIWVVADVAEGEVAPGTLKVIGAARNLADGLGAYVYGVLLGDGVTDLAQSLYQAGADGVRVADHPALASFALEPYLQVLADLFEAEQPEAVLFGATAMGRELAPRLAQRMGGGLIEEAVSLTLDEATRTIQGSVPIYGGEYFEVLACPEARPQFFTVQPDTLPEPFLDPHRRGEPTVLEVEPVEPRVRVVGPADDPVQVPFAQAPLVVAGGRQAGDFGLVERLADALGAQVGGDRGARDAGWVSADRVVDVRGVTIAPRIYVAVGIRGDTFHNAAVEGAGFILAIHPDPDVPIFRLADLGLRGDPAEIVPTLLEELRQN